VKTSKLRDFAPAARKSLMAAITSKALRFGISPGKPTTKPTPEGEFVRIAGVLHPKSMLALFNDLTAKIAKHGFDHVVEEAAYTWFNRLAAIRYMEVHGYFPHGLRVLSAPDDATLPEILQQAQTVEIDGLDRKAVLELLTLGNRQEELYQLLLRAQCHALSNSMPFLFDRIDGATELLTPDNLLSPSSIVRQIVSEIPEDDWRTTEILGWLYQFYVSEQKARVDGLVKKGQAVAPEDIPAKTQLFTPNWIVQFLVQNSLGRLWMDVYPDSPLRDQMPYYTPPAEQTPEVAAQLAAITPKYLDPTELTAIDPAAGSGHILLELYNLFFEMYREHGTLPSDIPRLIVERNVFGLELDRRAAQIAGFAVLMRARADDPRLLDNPPKLNVHAIRHSRDLDVLVLLGERKPEPIVPDQRLFEDEAPQPKLMASSKPLISDACAVRELVELFRDADIEGSLIRVPASLFGRLDGLEAEVKGHEAKSDLLTGNALDELQDLIGQARLLAQQFTACVANPPYLGGKAMAKELKDFAKSEYPNTKSDLFAMFLERGFDLAETNGFTAMVTMQSWMFLSSYEEFRKDLIEDKAICSMVHMGNGVMGIAFGTAATSIRNSRVPDVSGTYCYAEMKDLNGQNRLAAFPVPGPRCTSLAQSEFKKIPGWPIAYWAQPKLVELMSGERLESLIQTEGQNKTADNDRYVRYHWEVSSKCIGQGKHWIAYAKGGEFRRWYGNLLHVVDWSEKARHQYRISSSCRIVDERFWFREGITWTDISSGEASFRYLPPGGTFDMAGPTAFFESSESLFTALSLLNTQIVGGLLPILNPTLHVQLRDVRSLPFSFKVPTTVVSLAKQAVMAARWEWDCLEVSLGYQRDPIVAGSDIGSSVQKSQQIYLERLKDSLDSRLIAEARIELIWQETFGLPPVQVIPDTSKSQGSLIDNSIVSLISASIGCLMGRYSLDEPGLIYAHAGNEGFDPSRYRTFPADADGILPITDDLYFGDEDTAERLALWVKTVWPNSSQDENLAFIADSLYAEDGGRKPEETSLEAIRRYLVNDFYRDHLQTYKNRPIYWLFTSGKKKAFQALVYLHRYTPNTLSRMRSEYVQPLLGQLQSRLDDSRAKEQSATSTASKKAQSRLTKKLGDQYEELLEFDKRLHFYALQGIALDLDDGVKVNYGKFHDPKIGPILAEEKKITGGKDD